MLDNKCDDNQSHRITVSIIVSAVFLSMLIFVLFLLYITGSIELCSRGYLIFCAVVIIGLIVTIAAGILYKIINYISGKKNRVVSRT